MFLVYNKGGCCSSIHKLVVVRNLWMIHSPWKYYLTLILFYIIRELKSLVPYTVY